MTEYESFLKRFNEINLIEDEDTQLDEFDKLDHKIRLWFKENYPELDYITFLDYPSDDLKNTEKEFITQCVKCLDDSDLIDLVKINRKDLVNQYLNSKFNENC